MFLNQDASYWPASYIAIAEQINFKHKYFLIKSDRSKTKLAIAVAQLLSPVQLPATPWTAVCQAPLTLTKRSSASFINI